MRAANWTGLSVPTQECRRLRVISILSIRRLVWLELNRQGITVERCTTERLMRELGLQGVRVRAAPRTSHNGAPAQSRQGVPRS